MITCPCCKHEFEQTPPLSPPTGRQSELLTFLARYIAKAGYAPSYAEMAEHMGLASKAGINRLINGLEEQGFIRRSPGKTRAIVVVGSAA